MDRSNIFVEGDERSAQALTTHGMLDDHFEVGRVLGVGGFGITYLAWDTRLQTPVAIKEYLPRALVVRHPDRATVMPHSTSEQGAFRQGLDRFLVEARTLARFNHPNIVRVRSFFEENGTGYLVMDYLNGVSLKHFLACRDGRMDEDEAIAVTLALADGLQVVHDDGFLHRDVKPANVYLTTHGDPVLLDFGAARMTAEERGQQLSLVLTPGYAPFEQYHRAGGQGPWSDVYALAATLYHMVTGLVPPEAAERLERDLLHRADEWDPGASSALADVLAAALAVRPEDRLQDIGAFTDRLRAAMPGIEARQDMLLMSVAEQVRDVQRAAGSRLDPPALSEGDGVAATVLNPSLPDGSAPDPARMARTLIAQEDAGERAVAASPSSREVPHRLVRRLPFTPRVRVVAAGLVLVGLVLAAAWLFGGSAAHDDAATTVVNAPVTIAVLDNDEAVDGMPLSLDAVGPPEHGSATLNDDGTVTYRPETGFVGRDRFTYTAANGEVAARAYVVVRVVAAPNTAPTAVADFGVSDDGEAVTLRVLANDTDPDGDSLAVTAVSQPRNGNVEVIGGGRIWYQPFAGFVGADTLSYTVDDGRGGQAVGTVALSVGEALTPARMFARGRDAENRGHRAEAVRWYQRAADAGHGPASFELAKMYELGRGVSRDMDEAVRYYTQAAEQEYAEAQGRLGQMYFDGEGVTQDYDGALRWWDRGAENGDPHAQYGLGHMYEEGIGVAKDVEQAIRWYRLAADQDYRPAEEALRRLGR